MMADNSKSNFTFINVSHPDELKDPETIDHIRCSAMTNFGRMRRKRKEKKARNEIVFDVRTPGDAKSIERVVPSESMPDAVTMSRVGLETLDPFRQAPFEIDAERSGLISNIFGTNTGHSPAILDSWSNVGFHDDLSFQTVLFNSSLYGEVLRRQKTDNTYVNEDTPESLRLYVQGLEMINKRLLDPELHTSDALICSMPGFLTHQVSDSACSLAAIESESADGYAKYVIGDWTGWKRHMDGMLRMIKLRGGWETITNEHLRITLAWVDICGAFSQDLAPRFPLPTAWLQAISGPVERSRIPFDLGPDSISAMWQRELPDDLLWLSIFDDLSRRVSDSSISVNSWMEPFLHRLLAFRPLRSTATTTRASVIEEVCRIGTLLFLAPLWRTFGIHPVRTLALRSNLMHIMTSCFAEWGELRVLLVWTLLQAAREAENEVERQEFTMRVAMVMRKMHLGTWEEMVERVKRVLWTGAVGEEEWEKVRVILEDMLQRGQSPSPREEFVQLSGEGHGFYQ